MNLNHVKLLLLSNVSRFLGELLNTDKNTNHHKNPQLEAEELLMDQETLRSRSWSWTNGN